MVFEVRIQNHYLLSKRVIVLETFPFQLLVFDDCYACTCGAASLAPHRRCCAISILLQGVSSNDEWLPRAALLFLWASRLQRVKPFIPLCSNGSSQHPTRAKYSCCRKSMLLSASVLHAWQHRFLSALWRHLGVQKKLMCPVPVLSCASATRPPNRVHARPAAAPSRRNCVGILCKSYWDRLNCVWPYFCSGHFDLAKSRVASVT